MCIKHKEENDKKQLKTLKIFAKLTFNDKLSQIINKNLCILKKDFVHIA